MDSLALDWSQKGGQVLSCLKDEGLEPGGIRTNKVSLIGTPSQGLKREDEKVGL